MPKPIAVLVLSLLLASSLFIAFNVELAAAADDANKKEFISMDVTETPDAKAFANKMKECGWTNRGEGHELYKEDSGVVWDTDSEKPNIKAKDLKDAGVNNQADIMYLAAHGYKSDGRLTYPDQTVIAKPGDLANSPWNDDLEWAVFAACSVLFAEKTEKCWSGPGIQWAKALLGKDNPAHAILGYWGSAPASGVDKQIAEEFVDYMKQGKTVIEAWKQANKDHSTNWAYIVKEKNKDDKFTDPKDDDKGSKVIYQKSTMNEPAVIDLKECNATEKDGGIIVAVDKFGLLAPYIGLASTVLVATVAAAIFAERVKRRKEKQ